MPAYDSLSKTQQKIKDVHYFSGTTAGPSLNKYTRSSTSFNFLNRDIARDRGVPNALSRETTGSIYGGSIGSDN